MAENKISKAFQEILDKIKGSKKADQLVIKINGEEIIVPPYVYINHKLKNQSNG